jgi:aminopeptidase
MRDSRLDRLAHLLLNHSLRLNAGDIFQINAIPQAQPLVKALYREAKRQRLYPVVFWTDDEITRLEYDLLDPELPATAAFLTRRTAWNAARVADIQAVLTIRGAVNDRELSGVDPVRQQLVSKAGEAVSQTITNERQWVLFYWPTPAQAQQAGLSADDYFDFVLDVSLIDYERLYAAEKALADRLERADRVHVRGPGTDLTFSIAGLPAVCCCGRRNVPDGEVYTAPVRDSVQGTITYNVPAHYWGQTFNNINLTFENGRIAAAHCSGDEALLNLILDTDEGARSIGEFSFGVHPRLRQPVGSTLFDEKIAGSIHFTPGNAYARADNGNRSAIHWDLIQIQRPEYGGGEIWLDGEKLRQDGRFLSDALKDLNP